MIEPDCLAFGQQFQIVDVGAHLWGVLTKAACNEAK